MSKKFLFGLFAFHLKDIKSIREIKLTLAESQKPQQYLEDLLNFTWFTQILKGVLSLQSYNKDLMSKFHQKEGNNK